mmetsp:Transcript_7775/g.13089  ORF Transcript_7775/g.13089 Transcript_7775/m.13089 type:complete len:238 (+) Transcript_7775:190-903(+)
MQFEDAVGFLDEIEVVGAHQGQAEDGNIKGSIPQRHVGNVASSDVLVDSNEIKGVDLLSGTSRDRSLSTPKVSNDERRWFLAEHLNKHIDGVRGPQRDLCFEAFVILKEEVRFLTKELVGLFTLLGVERLVEDAKVGGLENLVFLGELSFITVVSHIVARQITFSIRVTVITLVVVQVLIIVVIVVIIIIVFFHNFWFGHDDRGCGVLVLLAAHSLLFVLLLGRCCRFCLRNEVSFS